MGNFIELKLTQEQRDAIKKQTGSSFLELILEYNDKGQVIDLKGVISETIETDKLGFEEKMMMAVPCQIYEEGEED